MRSGDRICIAMVYEGDCFSIGWVNIVVVQVQSQKGII